MADIMATKMDDYVIGIVGGMGSYATASFFERVLDSFPAEKEWERPRIVIDNKCTMPSRVRAILYNENYDLLVRELTESVKGLLGMGATKIVLACNTSHCFLKEVIENVPESEGAIVNIITSCAEALKNKGITRAYLMATEGTIISGIYEKVLSEYGICCVAPGEEHFAILRDFIEAIKQKKLTAEVKEAFVKYVNEVSEDAVILGCTELPILYEALGDEKGEIKKAVVDPLEEAINVIRRG